MGPISCLHAASLRNFLEAEGLPKDCYSQACPLFTAGMAPSSISLPGHTGKKGSWTATWASQDCREIHFPSGLWSAIGTGSQTWLHTRDPWRAFKHPEAQAPFHTNYIRRVRPGSRCQDIWNSQDCGNAQLRMRNATMRCLEKMLPEWKDRVGHLFLTVVLLTYTKHQQTVRKRPGCKYFWLYQPYGVWCNY